jgi:SNF2 family DNA or RNA helicase
LVAEGQKVLVFSQFVRMLQLLAQECRTQPDQNPPANRPDEKRQEVVAAFQNDPRPACFY